MLKFGNTYLNYNGTYFDGWKMYIDPNPLNLPPNTVRVRTNDGLKPYKNYAPQTRYKTATLVSGTTDVYDVYLSGDNFNQLLYSSYNVVEVLGANTTNITSMGSMFEACYLLSSVSLFDTSNVTDMSYMFGVTESANYSLSSIPLFDTSNVTSMESMFVGNEALTSVPLFNTSKVTNMRDMLGSCGALSSVPLFDTSNVTYMDYFLYGGTSLTSIPLFNTSKVKSMDNAFSWCYNVQSGALALYQQASTQAIPPVNHTYTFRRCGVSSEQGSAEYAQIPQGWK